MIFRPLRNLKEQMCAYSQHMAYMLADRVAESGNKWHTHEQSTVATNLQGYRTIIFQGPNPNTPHRQSTVTMAPHKRGSTWLPAPLGVAEVLEGLDGGGTNTVAVEGVASPPVVVDVVVVDVGDVLELEVVTLPNVETLANSSF